MKIRIGHSPDADDAFMFFALAEGKIPLEGFKIEHVIDDIESLNRRAFKGELEVTALSCHAFAHVAGRYRLLPYGASVGENYGPVVVARRDSQERKLRGARIAVPGKYTTANLILQIYEPEFQPVFIPFDEIFTAVEKGKADFGLLIHEGQLTFQERGFRKVVDLGEWWFEKFGLPLPLGVNAIRKDLGEETARRFASLFRKSIDYALTHREEAMGYALRFGRGLDPKRGDRFVGMYVNDYALDLGEKGREALRHLLQLGEEKGLVPRSLLLERLESNL